MRLPNNTHELANYNHTVSRGKKRHNRVCLSYATISDSAKNTQATGYPKVKPMVPGQRRRRRVVEEGIWGSMSMCSRLEGFFGRAVIFGGVGGSGTYHYQRHN